MSNLTKILLVFIVIGGIWVLGSMVFSEKTPRDISHNTPFLLKCDECNEMFNYSKKKWAAREYPPSEWKDSYRNRNDCLKCKAKWAAKIIGEGKPKDYVEPPPPEVAKKSKKKAPVAQKPQTFELPTINGKTDTFVLDPIPAPPINPKPRP